MLEAAETGHAIARARHAREAPRLREALLNAQYDLSQSGRGPVIIGARHRQPHSRYHG